MDSGSPPPLTPSSIVDWFRSSKDFFTFLTNPFNPNKWSLSFLTKLFNIHQHCLHQLNHSVPCKTHQDNIGAIFSIWTSMYCLSILCAVRIVLKSSSNTLLKNYKICDSTVSPHRYYQFHKIHNDWIFGQIIRVSSALSAILSKQPKLYHHIRFLLFDQLAMLSLIGSYVDENDFDNSLVSSLSNLSLNQNQISKQSFKERFLAENLVDSIIKSWSLQPLKYLLETNPSIRLMEIPCESIHDTLSIDFRFLHYNFPSKTPYLYDKFIKRATYELYETIMTNSQFRKFQNTQVLVPFFFTQLNISIVQSFCRILYYVSLSTRQTEFWIQSLSEISQGSGGDGDPSFRTQVLMGKLFTFLLNNGSNIPGVTTQIQVLSPIGWRFPVPPIDVEKCQKLYIHKMPQFGQLLLKSLEAIGYENFSVGIIEQDIKVIKYADRLSELYGLYRDLTLHEISAFPSGLNNHQSTTKIAENNEFSQMFRLKETVPSSVILSAWTTWFYSNLESLVNPKPLKTLLECTCVQQLIPEILDLLNQPKMLVLQSPQCDLSLFWSLYTIAQISTFTWSDDIISLLSSFVLASYNWFPTKDSNYKLDSTVGIPSNVQFTWWFGACQIIFNIGVQHGLVHLFNRTSLFPNWPFLSTDKEPMTFPLNENDLDQKNSPTEPAKVFNSTITCVYSSLNRDFGSNCLAVEPFSLEFSYLSYYLDIIAIEHSSFAEIRQFLSSLSSQPGFDHLSCGFSTLIPSQNPLLYGWETMLDSCSRTELLFLFLKAQYLLCRIHASWSLLFALVHNFSYILPSTPNVYLKTMYSTYCVSLYQRFLLLFARFCMDQQLVSLAISIFALSKEFSKSSIHNSFLSNFIDIQHRHILTLCENIDPSHIEEMKKLTIHHNPSILQLWTQNILSLLEIIDKAKNGIVSEHDNLFPPSVTIPSIISQIWTVVATTHKNSSLPPFKLYSRLVNYLIPPCDFISVDNLVTNTLSMFTQIPAKIHVHPHTCLYSVCCWIHSNKDSIKLSLWNKEEIATKNFVSQRMQFVEWCINFVLSISSSSLSSSLFLKILAIKCLIVLVGKSHFDVVCVLINVIANCTLDKQYSHALQQFKPLVEPFTFGFTNKQETQIFQNISKYLISNDTSVLLETHPFPNRGVLTSFINVFLIDIPGSYPLSEPSSSFDILLVTSSDTKTQTLIPIILPNRWWKTWSLKFEQILLSMHRCVQEEINLSSRNKTKLLNDRITIDLQFAFHINSCSQLFDIQDLVALYPPNKHYLSFLSKTAAEKCFNYLGLQFCETKISPIIQFVLSKRAVLVYEDISLLVDSIFESDAKKLNMLLKSELEGLLVHSMNVSRSAPATSQRLTRSSTRKLRSSSKTSTRSSRSSSSSNNNSNSTSTIQRSSSLKQTPYPFASTYSEPPLFTQPFANSTAYLCIDSKIQNLPWERILFGFRPTVNLCRVANICWLQTADKLFRKPLKAPNTYFILDPDGDLVKTRNRFEHLFGVDKNSSHHCLDLSLFGNRSKHLHVALKENTYQVYHNSKGCIGTSPTEQQRKALLSSDLYWYSGHNSGCRHVSIQHILANHFSKSCRKTRPKLLDSPMTMLMGCSSAHQKPLGLYQPEFSIPHFLLMTGAPGVVANLWDITDRECDRITLALFTQWFLANSSVPIESWVASASSSIVRFPLITGAACVYYGLPRLMFSLSKSSSRKSSKSRSTKDDLPFFDASNSRKSLTRATDFNGWWNDVLLIPMKSDFEKSIAKDSQIFNQWWDEQFTFYLKHHSC